MSLLSTVTNNPNQPALHEPTWKSVPPPVTSWEDSVRTEEAHLPYWAFMVLVVAALLSVGLGLLEYDRDPAGKGIVREHILPD